ncbi:flavin reductase family protein [Wenjunlia tyrosinilytica]|uniref:Monooxygenase n=1 Tax=Wenjunlia tyrosinilytica TaxID=1544741 RepID=A0A917ZMQ9_9ACTN|nr:flavin reductase family protein [Wenjunlia tyrosinilytica]GGO86798.1 monooxygenase [Wenjunlia tyrosinilytica]
MGHEGMAAAAVRYLRSAGVPPPDEPAAAAPPTLLRTVCPSERTPLDPAEFRRVMGHFPTGVAVVTAPAAEGESGPAGFACQSFSSLSLQPPLVSFQVARTSATWPRIARSGVFCANVLSSRQGELCRAFAVSGADKFAGVDWDPAAVTGSPRLRGCLAWVDCTIQAVHTGGDHLIVVGRVEDLDAAGGDPLLYFRGSFHLFDR